MPVLALTAHAIQGYRERCIEAGMDGYVAKPIQSGALFAAISGVMGDLLSVSAASETSVSFRFEGT